MAKHGPKKSLLTCFSGIHILYSFLVVPSVIEVLRGYVVTNIQCILRSPIRVVWRLARRVVIVIFVMASPA
jgi:hypothetical protein